MSIENREETVIEFDNLVQADPQMYGKVEPVMVEESRNRVEPFNQPNASGELYRPAGREDVKRRAACAGERFAELFESSK